MAYAAALSEIFGLKNLEGGDGYIAPFPEGGSKMFQTVTVPSA